ncbi:hypothetical protein TPHA_0P01590 [Tetrapisispora phaffii CBS 4417]|uniref:RNA polymerase-associated protein CTR9 n=1 Tax=Tetrapisispora phaffii (strain ATCC 24235 / CBS 4417 / NBRC 1672 / NRRL Y-8282 / UCD 70-5) TaxID=1071381 RepID=G8C2D9_TETPH|nr:hypothetical protein TPHA_0P01590 [Tetrapisispora phaffii CBS 4417]CCE66317.1 hypothetical protein TPHA_0P01590 [Tetrapisispora phaffii CBS 4417]
MESESLTSYPSMQWSTALDIPLKASEEVVSIDLETDLPDDPSDLRTLLVEESSDKEHWLTIALAYCHQGKVTDGIKLIEMALEAFRNTDKAPLHTFLTWAHLDLAKGTFTNSEAKQYELNQAEYHLKEAINYDPSTVSNMLATIDLYYQRGQYDKALETSDIFIKGIAAEDRRNGRTTKTNCLFLLLRAKILYQKKNYSASLRFFQELLVLNPVLKPDPRIGIGMCFWQLKDHSMAVKSWSRAKEIDPENKTASILVLLGDFHNSLTNSENDEQFKKQYSEAILNLENLYSGNKSNPVILTLLQSYFYFKGEYQSVIDIYEKKIMGMSSITANTILSEASFWCARSYYALNDYRKAFTMFQESLKKSEDNLLSKFGLGQTQIKNDLLEEGILTFENIYKSHENIQELNYILGLLYARKCLDTKTEYSHKEHTKLISKAVQFLEKYISLTTSKKNQLVIPKAFLILSQLYELQVQYKQALDILCRYLDDLKISNEKNIPIELLNNIGCFYFITGQKEKSLEFFNMAKEKLDLAGNDDSLEITLQYNIARSSEEDLAATNIVYSDILSKHPSYVHLKVRYLFTKFLQNKNSQSDEIEKEVNDLLQRNPADLEVRALYTWFMKNGLKNSNNIDEAKYKEYRNSEISTSKDTLTKYNSHDLYALISLGNFYCVMAKENKKTPAKCEQSYLKGIQLYQKALQIDPYNIFAAQGIAIIFAESKRLGAALEIWRKIRDSLDTEDVHMNISHCLLEMREYVKAIEGYELILKKFPNYSKLAKVYNLLGKTWYERGNKENSLSCYKKALQNAETSLKLEIESSNDLENSPKIASYKFNTVLLHFQIAEVVRRSGSKDRTVEDISSALTGLENALVLLKELKDKSYKFIVKDEIEQRIQLGETTMKNALQRSLKEQEEYELQQTGRLEQARKLIEENELKEKNRIEKEKELEQMKIAKQKEEFAKLQEEAQKIIQERDLAIVEESDNDKDLNSADEDGEFVDKEKPKREKKSKKKTSKRKADVLDDDEEVTIIRKRERNGKASTLSAEYIENSSASSDGALSDVGENKFDSEEAEAKVTDEEHEDLF